MSHTIMRPSDPNAKRVVGVSETTLSLSPSEIESLRHAAEDCIAAGVISHPEEFVARAQDHFTSLPANFITGLRTFRRYGSPTGGLLIHQCPLFEVPATPSSPALSIGTTLVAAGVLGIITGAIGDQYGFEPELAGHIIQDIVPVAGFEQTQQSISSEEDLYLHVESAFTDDRADYVALFCLRADHEGVAATTLSPIDGIMQHLSANDVRILREPRFKTTVDESFLRGIGTTDPIYVGPIRVFSGSFDRPRIRADFAETSGLDNEAQGALNELRRSAERAVISFRLQPGDLLFVDNHHAFHGRTSFRARWDGADRWLLRTFVTRDLSRSEGNRSGDGRIIDNDYSRGDHIFSPGK